VPGINGQAYQLNGVNGQITVPNNASLNPAAFTVGGWFNLAQAPATGSEYYLASKYDGNYHGWILRLNSNMQVGFSLFASPSSYFNLYSPSSLSPNTWYYISASYDGNTATLYVNGVAVATQTLAGGYQPSATPLVIGSASWFQGGYTNGKVDGFTFFNRSLTPLEESELYNDSSTGNAGISPAAAPSLPNGVGRDQRGYLRPVGGGMDIGAVEYQYDLAINGSAPLLVGNNNLITYTLTVTNNGPDPVAGATLTDLLPSTLTFQSLTAPTGWTVSSPAVGQTGTVTATDSTDLDSGASATFTLVVQANDTTEGSVISDTASVGPTTWDDNSSNNSVTLSSTMPTEPEE